MSRPLSGRWPFAITIWVMALLGYLPTALAWQRYPVPPDKMSCSKELGRPLARWKCQAAIDQMPKGRLPSIFTTRQRSPENGWVTVPQRFHDNQGINGCIVHIDLDGHSTKDVFVMVPWDEIREMAQIIMDSCVWQMGSGGFITYGLGKTLQSLTGPVLYDINGREVPRPAWAQQPDGSINAVAVPYDKGAGYSE